MTEARDAWAVEQIRNALGMREDRSRTHWDGCETDPRHRDCALRVVLRAYDRLRAVCEESNDACICGCPSEEHDNYGEDGEVCQEPTHECLRTSKAVYAHLSTLRAELDRLRAERDDAALITSWRTWMNEAGRQMQRARDAESSVQALRRALVDMAILAKQATNGWACYASRSAEHVEIARLHHAIDAGVVLAALPGEAAQETQK